MPLKKKVIRSLISAVPLGVTVASLTVNLTACSTSITLLTLLGNGQNGTIDTTIVTLTSDKPIIGLSNNDISFTNANVVVNSVTTDKNVYTINITGDWINNTTVGIKVSKKGYRFANKTSSITLWKDTQDYVDVTNLRQNGGMFATVDTKSLSFDADSVIPDLTIDNITFTNSKINKGTLSFTGTTYTITITGNWANNDTTTMTIDNPTGDVITNDTTAVTLYKDTQEYVTISNLRQNDGKSGTADTQSLSFDADSVIDGLAVGDITFTNSKINKGELSVIGTTYTVTIDGTWGNTDTTTMTIESPVGDVITNDTNAVTLYKDTQEYVTISNLRQNGGKSSTADTVSLSFDADSVIDGLAVGDITFTNAKINKGELSVSGTTYTVTIDGTWGNTDTTTMTIESPVGDVITNDTNAVTLYKDTQEYVTISNLRQNGGESGTAGTVSLSFDADSVIDNLTVGDITFTNSKINKGELSVSGTTYTVAITGNWADKDTTTMTIENPVGDVITNDTNAVILYKDTQDYITISNLRQNGGKPDTADTVSLSFDANAAIPGLAVGDITFTNSKINKGELSVSGTTYTVTIDGTWSNTDTTTMTIDNPTGDVITNDTTAVTLYKDTQEYVTISNLRQNDGKSGTADTQSLSFDADSVIDGLAVGDITFTNSKINKGELSVSGTTYTVTIDGTWGNTDTTTMTIESPVGDVITNDTNAVTLYKDTQEYVTISNLRQNGGKSGTADTVSLSFDADSVIDDLAVGDITFTNSNINKGELSVSGTTYTVTIDGTWSNTDTTTMTIESPAGDVITNDTNAVTLYKDIRPQIVVSDLQSNGTSDESTTTNISWTMNNQSIRFTVDDITLTPGGTATINKEHVYYDVDTGKYFLEISGTWEDSTSATLSITKAGYKFTIDNPTVTLYKDNQTHIHLLTLVANGGDGHWTSQLYLFIDDLSKWDDSWTADDNMTFTIDGNPVFAGKGLTIEKNTDYITIVLTGDAQAQFSNGKMVYFEMSASGYEFTGGPLTAILKGGL